MPVDGGSGGLVDAVGAAVAGADVRTGCDAVAAVGGVHGRVVAGGVDTFDRGAALSPVGGALEDASGDADAGGSAEPAASLADGAAVSSADASPVSSSSSAAAVGAGVAAATRVRA